MRLGEHVKVQASWQKPRIDPNVHGRCRHLCRSEHMVLHRIRAVSCFSCVSPAQEFAKYIDAMSFDDEACLSSAVQQAHVSVSLLMLHAFEDGEESHGSPPTWFKLDANEFDPKAWYPLTHM